MTDKYWVIALSNAAYGTLGAFVGGLIVAGALVWAVRLGIRTRRRESLPPTPAEQPRLPETGPVRETSEIREPSEVPRAADKSDRLTPRQVQASGSRRSDRQERPRWESER
ncbi:MULTISPECIES: DUF6479 family protein [unclassified Streptomyces]|uniref:DUF6479 family protein n=1 Tax=unclassified Streptomyces TaxID=2593676 RepID=UPI0036AEEFC0